MEINNVTVDNVYCSEMKLYCPMAGDCLHELSTEKVDENNQPVTCMACAGCQRLISYMLYQLLMRKLDIIDYLPDNCFDKQTGMISFNIKELL